VKNPREWLSAGTPLEVFVMSFQESFFVTFCSLEEQVPQKVAEKDFEQEVTEISERTE